MSKIRIALGIVVFISLLLPALGQENTASYWIKQGTALSKSGQYGAALQAFDRAIELKPANANAWEKKALTLKKLGDYNDALQAFDRVIELKPANANAWENKALTLKKMGDYNDALQAFDRVIDLKPANANAWKNKALTLKKMGKLYDNEALQAFAKAIELGSPAHIPTLDRV